MEESTATLRTFSQDKYDAMEANISYKDKNILKKRKNKHNEKLLLLVTILLCISVLCLVTNLFTNYKDDSDYSPSRVLYESYNIDEMPEYNDEQSELLDNTVITSNVEGFDSQHFNDYDIYSYNKTETKEEELEAEVEEIEKETIHSLTEANLYKYKYYNLLEVCAQHLRRG